MIVFKRDNESLDFIDDILCNNICFDSNIVIIEMRNEKQLRKTLAEHTQSEYQHEIEYLSPLCQKGPLPQRYASFTDKLCIALFSINLILVIVFVSIDWGNQASRQQQRKKLFSEVILKFTTQMNIAAFVIMSSALVISIMNIFFPDITPIVLISALLVTNGVLAFNEMKLFLQNVQLYHRLIISTLNTIGFFSTLGILFARRDKLKFFAQFTQISSIVCKNRLVVVVGFMVLYSLFQIGIWWVFLHYYYDVTNFQPETCKIDPTITWILYIILWGWCHGLFIAISNYLTISYTVNWYYSHANQQEDTSISSILKLLFKHIGSLFFGAVLAFVPQFVLVQLRKNKKLKNYSFFTYSNYAYVLIIMQHKQFNAANKKLNIYKKRIQTFIPELYMVGNLLCDLFKLTYIILTLTLFYEFIYSNNKDQRIDLKEFLIIFVLLGFGILLQIATNFANITTIIGDICYFLYNFDADIQRSYMTKRQSLATPPPLQQILRRLTVQRSWNGKIRENNSDL